MTSFRFLAAFAPLLTFAACAPAAESDTAAANAPTGEIVLAGCRQGECSWMRLLGNEAAGTQTEGALRRIQVRRGRSVHLDGKIPSGPSEAEIEWDKADRTEYAFCSTRRPAYAFPGDDGGLIVHFLDLFDLGGYQMGSGSLYMRFCHDQPGLPDEQKLRALGYASGTRSEQVEAAGPEVMTRF